MAPGRLADGSSTCPWSCTSCHTGGKVLEERVSAEKRLLSHGVSRGVHINAGMRRPPELYAHQCPQLGRGLKTDKKISVP